MKSQRFVNAMPRETRARRDPSSFAQRFFSFFGDVLEQEKIQNLKIMEYDDPFKQGFEQHETWSINLVEADYIQSATSTGGSPRYTFPLTVTANPGAIELVRNDYLEEVFYGAPTRITAKTTQTLLENVIYDSSISGVVEDIGVPERLWVVVSDSSNYRNRNNDPSFSGASVIRIVGRDENDKPLTEVLSILDDGIYVTRNIYSSIEEPEWDGFDGDITIRATGGNDIAEASWVRRDPWRIGVTEDIEGPLDLSMSTTEVDSDTYSILEYRLPIFQKGADYRDSDNGPIISNLEYIGDQALLDASGNPYEVVDFYISPFDTRLYVLDTEAMIHVYDHGLSAFSPPDEEISGDSYIRIQPTVHYLKMGGTMKMFTWLERPHKKISKVLIWRVSPSSVQEYLQPDFTWDPAIYYFPGDPTEGLAPATWNDKFFDVTFEELGQWDFYARTFTADSTDTTTHTAVLIDRLLAVTSLDTSIVTSLDGLYFNKQGYIVVRSGTTLHPFKLNRDAYIADPQAQQLYFREDYDSVEVVY